MFDSADNGRTWQKSGVLPAADLFIYNAAIDPSNRDHIVVGTMSVGAFVTFDGGRHWTAPRPRSSTATRCGLARLTPDLLYFSYGTSFGGYGSDLYRFRPSTGELTWKHNQHDGIPSLAFNRADPTRCSTWGWLRNGKSHPARTLLTTSVNVSR